MSAQQPLLRGPGADLVNNPPRQRQQQQQSGSSRFQRLTASRVQPLVRLKLKKVRGANRIADASAAAAAAAEVADAAAAPLSVAIAIGGVTPAILPTPRSALQRLEGRLPANPSDEDREQLRKAIVDPFLSNRRASGIPRTAWAALPVVFACTLTMQLLCLGIDRLTIGWTYHGVVPSYYLNYDVYGMLWTMLNPTYDQAQAVMNAVNVYLVFIISLLISIIGLVLNFATDKITENVTILVFKDKFIVSGMGAVILNTCWALWTSDNVGDAVSSRTSVYLNVLSVVMLLVLLFPYILYLFSFLDIEVVVTKVMVSGLNSIISSINTSGANLLENERNQVNTASSIEDLMDAAIAGIKKRSTNITSEIIDALCSFSMHYASVKERAPDCWFTLPVWMRQSPDFVMLTDEGAEDVRKRHLWVEWKILRQYQILFVEAIRDLKEMCHHICLNTRIIAESGIQHNRIELVDIVFKFFNTYLRTAINAKDFRVIYNTLFQYRQLAESLLDRNRVQDRHFLARGLKAAKFIRYYAFICQQSRLFFLVETAAHDMRALCQKVLQSAVPKRGAAAGPGVSRQLALFREAHEKCLEIFLSLDDFTFGPARPGVRRQQIMLAAFYLSEGQLSQAQKIKRQLDHKEDRDLMVQLREELSAPTTREFWEVSERGSNFAHVDQRLRQQLPVFFSWFPWLEECNQPEFMVRYWASAEGKRIRVMQELQNFEVERFAAEDEEDEEEEEEDVDGLEVSPNAPVIVHLND